MAQNGAPSSNMDRQGSPATTLAPKSTSHSPGSPQTDKPTSVEKFAKVFHIPASFTPSLTDSRQWKNFFRCMLVTLGTIAVMFAQSSLEKLGQAAFFGAIMSQMLPPYFALSIYLFALLTLVFGILFGWAWGVAAMAAGLRARSQVLLAEQVQTQRAGYDTNANIDAQYQASIFHGAFLDPRSTAVYGVFFFVGCYTLGFLRAKKPRLVLGCIFSTIILDLMCSYGPLFPIAQYTLARQLLVPAACFMAMALASIFLIFPQTLNHMTTQSLVKGMLGPTIALLKVQNEVVHTSPADTERWTKLAAKTYETKTKHVAAVVGLQGQLGLLQMEITRGQIGPTDLQRVFAKCKDLGAKSYALSSFLTIVEEQHQGLRKFADDPSQHTTVRSKLHFDKMEKSIREAHSLSGLLPILAESTSDLRSNCTKSLDDISEWLLLVNHTRWKKKPASAPSIAQREGNLAAVKASLAEFRESKHFAILQPYRDSFDPATGQLHAHLYESHRYASRDLFRCFVFTSTLIAFALTLIELLELLLEIERANPKSKIQWPKAFAKNAIKTANQKEGMGGLDVSSNDGSTLDVNGDDHLADHDDDASGTSTAVDNDKKEKKTKEKKTRTYAKDPDAEDPRNALQRFGRSVHDLWKGLTSNAGIFALKYATVSLALWIPAICPSSAYFNYANRGLWALIMAQTGLGVFAGETILNFVIRMSGTVLGLIVGMVAWYIGAGTGRGNPYGVAAATMVLIAPCLFIRIAIPAEKSAFFLMTNVTAMLVIGYGWVDEHVYQLSNQGSGAALAGRRALLVIIGFVAAFLITVFPRPTSARVLYRQRAAKNMKDIGALYGAVVTEIEGEMDVEAEENGSGGEKVRAQTSELRREKFKGGFMKVLERLMAMQAEMAFAGAEPGLKGKWPRKKYQALFKAQSQVLSTLALLSASYARMEVKWCQRLAMRSELMHPAFIADCLSLFSILQQSLRTGEPLPPLIPIFERLAFHRTKLQAASAASAAAPGGTQSVGSGSKLTRGGGEEGGIEGEALEGFEMVARGVQVVLEGGMTWQSIHEEQTAVFATANIALVHITVGLNEMFRIVASLVGEKELTGLERASERWARREAATSV